VLEKVIIKNVNVLGTFALEDQSIVLEVVKIIYVRIKVVGLKPKRT